MATHNKGTLKPIHLQPALQVGMLRELEDSNDKRARMVRSVIQLYCFDRVREEVANSNIINFSAAFWADVKLSYKSLSAERQAAYERELDRLKGRRALLAIRDKDVQASTQATKTLRALTNVSAGELGELALLSRSSDVTVLGIQPAYDAPRMPRASILAHLIDAEGDVPNDLLAVTGSHPLQILSERCLPLCAIQAELEAVRPPIGPKMRMTGLSARALEFKASVQGVAADRGVIPKTYKTDTSQCWSVCQQQSSQVRQKLLAAFIVAIKAFVTFRGGPKQASDGRSLLAFEAWSSHPAPRQLHVRVVFLTIASGHPNFYIVFTGKVPKPLWALPVEDYTGKIVHYTRGGFVKSRLPKPC